MDSDSADDQLLLQVKTKRPKLKAFSSNSSSDDDEPLAKKQKPHAKKHNDIKVKKDQLIAESNSDDNEPLVKNQKKRKESRKKSLPSSKDAKVKKERKPTVKKVKSDHNGPPSIKAEEGDTKKSSRVKKLYEKPGQKYDEPSHLDCLRLFYESLYHEEVGNLGKRKGPLSMAEQWCMERGLFTHDQNEILYKRHIRAA